MSNVLNDFTVIELLDAAAERIMQKGEGQRPGVGRNFAVALTAIEDAQMRYNRGQAIELGLFNPADLDKGKSHGTE